MSKKRPFFDPVDLNIDFPTEEKKILEFWYKKGVVKKYLNRNKSSKKYFSFLDGPITANNPMGVHHAWGRTYKDLWPRFYNMRGYKQRFQNGFDCQGLWVEVEVEKELGFKSKKDIEKFGVAKFVDLCKKRVKKYSEIQTEQSKRLGYFADWEHSYYTLSEDNNYMIWRFIKTCNDNGWLYKGNDSVPWCPRCETAISQHEMLTEDYKEATHESVYLSFPIVGRKDEYLMVWTTTPWTIPANIAIAVDSKLLYAQVEFSGKKYWVAKDSIANVFGSKEVKILKEEWGSKLVGLKYTGAFDDIPKVTEVAKKNETKFHTVVPTDDFIMPITTVDGTGLVHTAVSAGTEDFKLGKKLELPMIPVIEDDASYMSDMDFLSGKNAKKDPSIVINYLKDLDSKGKHFIFKSENYTHRYPACWRCKEELVWKVTDEWYIAMDKPSKVVNPANLEKDGDSELQTPVFNNKTLRERMIDVAQKINWYPSFGLERELDWLRNMHDWLISKKNRFWGLALPIWECSKCNTFQVVGSKEELEEKAVSGYAEFEGKSPHKPQIDLVKLVCPTCGQKVSRIEPVGNPWLDAGIVAFSTISDNNKAANFEPTNTKPLYLTNREEWLKWFPVSQITESFPGQFKNWFYSLIVMSTVFENRNPFKSVLGYGTLLGEDGRAMHKSWGNSIEFNEGADKIGVDVMRFMFTRQNPSENMLFGYKVADEVRRRFHLKLWNIYNFFVTYANLSGYKPLSTKNVKVRAKKVSVLDKWILLRLSETVDKVTQSLEQIDAFSASTYCEEFLDDLSNWYVRRSRERVSPNVDINSKKAFFDTCYFVLVTFAKLLAPFTPFLSEKIFKNLTKELSVHLSDWPKVEKLKATDKDLLKEMSMIRSFVEKVHSIRKEKAIPVRQPLKSATVSYPEVKIRSEIIDLAKSELNVKAVILKKSTTEKYELDTEITPELLEEANTRKLIRDVQEQRKIMKVDLADQIEIISPWVPKNQKFLKILKEQTKAREVRMGDFKVIYARK